MKGDATQTAIDKFNNAVKSLLNPCNEEEVRKSNSLFLFIRNLLRNKQITNIEEKEVFTEAYLRALKSIKKRKQEIVHPTAFLKKIATYYVSEIQREQVKYLCYDTKILDEQTDPLQTKSGSYLESFSEQQLDNLDNFLDQLSPLDKKILDLWQIDDMKWKDIVEQLKDQGEFLSTISARKRGQRIMDKLKKQMKP